MLQRPVLKVIVSYVESILAFFLAVAVLIHANAHRMPSGIGVQEFLLYRITLLHILLASVFLAAWKPCFQDLDRLTFEQRALGVLLARLIRGCSSATFVLGGILLVARVHTSMTAVLPLFWLGCFLLVSFRLLLHGVRENSLWKKNTQMLILGTGPLAKAAWRELRTRHHSSVNVLGFVDKRPPTNTYPEISTKYLGNIDELEDILLRHIVDVIVIAMPAKSCYTSIQKAISVSDEVGVDAVQFGTFFERAGQGNPRFTLEWHHDNGDALAQFLKRSLDLIGSVAALVVLAPLLLLVALTIKCTSPGPVLFVQERYGFRRRKFRLVKFRTMVINAEQMMSELEQHNEAAGPIFKMKNDPRVTAVGRFLRKTSIDELPQLWNVLTGAMSLVGPRPMSVRDVSLFSSSYLMRRFRVRPGITGLWQVSGRSNVSFDQWIAMDFRYIDNWSLSLDLQILLRTVPAVLKGSGAM